MRINIFFILISLFITINLYANITKDQIEGVWKYNQEELYLQSLDGNITIYSKYSGTYHMNAEFYFTETTIELYKNPIQVLLELKNPSTLYLHTQTISEGSTVVNVLIFNKEQTSDIEASGGSGSNVFLGTPVGAINYAYENNHTGTPNEATEIREEAYICGENEGQAEWKTNALHFLGEKNACICHDYCYTYGFKTYGFSRSNCDEQFFWFLLAECHKITLKNVFFNIVTGGGYYFLCVAAAHGFLWYVESEGASHYHTTQQSEYLDRMPMCDWGFDSTAYPFNNHRGGTNNYSLSHTNYDE